jgi:hypothetical protein
VQPDHISQGIFGYSAMTGSCTTEPAAPSQSADQYFQHSASAARLYCGPLRLERQADLEYLDRVELEFRIQAALDGGGLAKAVLLARKQQIAN